MSDMGADEQDARAAEEWRRDIRAAFEAEYGVMPRCAITEDDGGTWFVETAGATFGEWHRTFEVIGAPGQPITFVEI